VVFGSKGRNFRIQLFFAPIVLLTGALLKLSLDEWLIIIFMIFIVLCAELINSAVEEVCNIVKDLPGILPEATKEARDIAAGSVLVISVGAAIIGLLIFLPRFLSLFYH
jgi:undecaprenol kinase